MTKQDTQLLEKLAIAIGDTQTNAVQSFIPEGRAL